MTNEKKEGKEKSVKFKTPLAGHDGNLVTTFFMSSSLSILSCTRLQGWGPG